MNINRRTSIGVVLVGLATAILSPRAVGANKQIIKLAKIKVGGTHQFQLSNGAPALLFRTKTGVFAYQTICTHEGGIAKYLSARKLIICAVHNASFNPFNKGKVVAGPAKSALPSIKVEIAGDWVVLV